MDRPRTPGARPSPGPGPLVAGGPPLDPAEYDAFARAVRDLVGLDLAQYKPAQVWRRTHAFAALRGLPDWRRLLAACRADKTLRRAFADMLTINVSEFFRNPEAWETLATEVLRPRLAGGGIFRAWSAGCSTGQEPYSLAILLRELAPGVPARILATDVDEAALTVAEGGRYEETQLAGLAPARRGRAFLPDGDGWIVRPEIRALVRFRRHDLLRDPPPTGFDLVLCRNVVIYFTEEAKDPLYRRLAGALRSGGVLFLGATEMLPRPERYGLRSLRPGFFRREGEGSPGDPGAAGGGPGMGSPPPPAAGSPSGGVHLGYRQRSTGR